MQSKKMKREYIQPSMIAKNMSMLSMIAESIEKDDENGADDNYEMDVKEEFQTIKFNVWEAEW